MRCTSIFFTAVTTYIILFSANAFSQGIIYTLLAGDSLNLKVSGYHGQVQWQHSDDNVTFNDMFGVTGDSTVCFVPSGSSAQKYYRARIIDTICPNSPTFSTVVSHKLVQSASEVQIGDWFRGGKVFYTSGTGNGVVATLEDQATISAWGCRGTDITNAESEIDGQVNTQSIVNECAERPIAASLCSELEYNGYNDWFLPAKNQLNMMYNQQYYIGNFPWGYSWWSSTEIDTLFAWNQNFVSGTQSFTERNTSSRVRCVHYFNPSVTSRLVSLATTVTGQPEGVVIIMQPDNFNGCSEKTANFVITITGTTPVSYQWKKDGTDISGQTAATYTINNLSAADEGIYTCEVTNICRSLLSDDAELKVIELTADAGTSDVFCPGGSTQLQAGATSNYSAESGNFSFSWLPVTGLDNANIYNPVAGPVIPTDYTVVVTDEVGCTAESTVNVFVQTPYSDEEICIVTVDTITWKNKVLWNITQGYATASYGLYKETAVNTYDLLDVIPFTSPAEYIDVSSNPEIHGDKYKITVIDTCGNESDLSYYHKTMNLTIAATGSTMGLNWDHYVDESGMFVPAKYYIYRGSSPDQLQLYDSISGSFHSYNDVNITTVYYYLIGVKNSNGCNNITKEERMSYSNKKDNTGLIGINENNIMSGTVIISPNPMSTSATLTIPNLKSEILNPKHETGTGSDFVLRISDLTGKVVRSEPIPLSPHGLSPDKPSPAQLTIERGDLKPGIYFVELKADRVYRGKLVVE